MAPSYAKAALLALALAVPAWASDRYTHGYGFIGYGITMYKPVCATACRGSVSNPLNCNGTVHSHHKVKRMGGMSMEKPTPECYATNDEFLQSVAYCISTHCENVPIWELEEWWDRRIPGRSNNQPEPKETYQQTLARLSTPPTTVVPSDEMLMENTLVDEEDWQLRVNGDGGFEVGETRNVTFCIILLVAGAAIPILLSLLRFVPFPRNLASRFNAYFIDPPVFGSKHSVAWLNTFIAPTRGQALFILYLWTINIILCSVGYHSKRPNSWWETASQEFVTLVSYRTGLLSFANLVLMVLYAGRNNFLLWLTNWSHSTFLLIHRWLAFICCLQACLHSALLLQVYVSSADYDYMAESQKPYWVWGIVATLGLVILLPTSILPIRQKAYELFLAWHVVLAFFVLLGCFWHVVLCFDWRWGYHHWILIAFACWGFERGARLLRLARNGLRTGQVTVIDDDYIRLDVPGLSASGQAYLYFPTLTWRVWENHPFSVASALVTTSSPYRQRTGSGFSSSLPTGEEKLPIHGVKAVGSDSGSSSPVRATSTKAFQVGLTFFVRTHTGLTSKLRDRKTLPVLVESSYGHNIYGDHGGSNLSSYPNLVCIAGGVGITAVLPFLASHVGRSKLYWGVRTPALVDAMQDTLNDSAYAGVEVEVAKGERLYLEEILAREISNDEGSGTAIVVSGPASMADSVRNIVSQLTQKDKTAVVALIEESYTW